jgi:glyoxylase-like metal-dependent hydrolase (beta-lactamase superfamily II)
MTARSGDRYELFVLEYARSVGQPVASLLLGVYDRGAIDLPFAFCLARNEERCVLIDTGFMREGRGATLADKFSIPHWVSPLRMLEAIDVRPEQVTDIVLTHAHYDHMGSIDQFPSAHLYLQERELLAWISAMALPKRFAFLTMALDPDDVHEAIRASEEHRLTLLTGDKDNVLPGIHARLGADSHTFGSQYVIVETAKGRHVVSGDCAYSYKNFTGVNNEGVYIPLGFGVGSHFESLKVIDRMQDEVGGDLNRVVILHDDERWTRFEQVAEVDGFRVARVG